MLLVQLTNLHYATFSYHCNDPPFLPLAERSIIYQFLMFASAHKLIALTILIALGGILTLSIVAFLPHEAGHGHTMSGSNCPFMNHKESICPMDLQAHLSLLESVFTANTPSLPLLLILSVTSFLCIALPLNRRRSLRDPRRVRWRWLTERSLTFDLRGSQEHFASGLLNPKLYHSLPS